MKSNLSVKQFLALAVSGISFSALAEDATTPVVTPAPVVAPAVTNSPIENRIQNQEKQIRNAAAKDEITRGEEKRLLKNDAKIQRAETRDAASGKGLSDRERRQLNQAVNRNEANLHRDEPRVENRIENQERQIKNAEAKGEINQGQADRLLNNDKKIERAEVRDEKSGKGLNSHEKRELNQSVSRNEQRLHHDEVRHEHRAPPMRGGGRR